ncbi:DUF6844 domain-containing protein [Vibrio maerlii]|uniref:DUF6844 domain-containing protein n=1 Tax=Vibrio maerlii TaxID=2231648 RepID=UPI000F4DF1C9|nr:hypothetical protein [Vibrio maerlii]
MNSKINSVFNKVTLSILLIGGVSSHALASDSVGVAEKVENSTQSADQIVTNVREPIDEVEGNITRFISAQQQQLTRANLANQFKFYSGVAMIPVTQDNAEWAVYRGLALNEAVAKAREEYLTTLNRDFATETVQEFFRVRGLEEPSASDFQSPTKFGQLMDKAIALVDGAMMSQLDDMGIPSAEFRSAPPQKQQNLMRDYFETRTISRAYGDLSGLFVTKTFESYDSSGRGTVGVVMVLSNTRRDHVVDLIESEGQVKPTPERADARYANVSQAIANEPNKFLNKGVHLRYDEKGYPMLVAYGQAGVPYSADPDERYYERRAASEFAESDAWSALAASYNLSGDYAKQDIQAKVRSQDRTTTLVGPGTTSTSTTSVQNNIRTMVENSSSMTASLKGLTGVSVEHKWREQHPTTGQEVSGVVLVWHPTKVRESIALQRGVHESEVHRQTQAVDAPSTTEGASESFESESFFNFADF